MKKTAVRVAVLAVVALALSVGVALAQGPAKVAGKWEMTREGRQGPVTSALTFEQDGENLKGTLAGQQGEPAPLTGTIKGNKIAFTVKRQTPRGEFTVEYTGTVEGDAMKGTFTMGQGDQARTVDWTAKRVK